MSWSARKCLNAPAFAAGSSGRLCGAAPAVVCARLCVEVIPLGPNASSAAAIMQLERKRSGVIIDVTVVRFDLKRVNNARADE
jgi:hypothetical protein